MIENIRRAVAEGWARSRAPGRLPAGRMDAKHLLLVLLALVPAVSTSGTPGEPGSRVPETLTEASVVEHDGVRGASCRDLRDAELILAEHQIELLDELESDSAPSRDRRTAKDELDDTRASLEDLDQALAAARCPASPEEAEE